MTRAKASPGGPGDQAWEESDGRWMDRAIRLARRAARSGEVPVGAIVVSGDLVIGRGANAPIRSSDPTAHAELIALRRAARASGNYRLTGATLYVTLEPCLMCLGAMVHARIDRLVYGASDPRVGAVELMRLQSGLNHNVVVTGGVEAERCAEILKDFFRQRRPSSA